jgi:hypothetical protein
VAWLSLWIDFTLFVAADTTDIAYYIHDVHISQARYKHFDYFKMRFSVEDYTVIVSLSLFWSQIHVSATLTDLSVTSAWQSATPGSRRPYKLNVISSDLSEKLYSII